MAIIILIASCNSRQDDRKQGETVTSAIEVKITELLTNPLEFDSETVETDGTISHVCRHSGDKMRVLQDGSDLSILVMLGDFTGHFNTESEGLKVTLSGKFMTEVSNIDELNTYIQEHEDESGHECENTREAIEAMESRGLDASIRTFIALEHYELN